MSVKTGQAQSEAYDNAHRFVVTWLSQDLDTTVWRARLTELASVDLTAEIASADFARPRASVTRGDLRTRSRMPDRIEFVFDTDADMPMR